MLTHARPSSASTIRRALLAGLYSIPAFACSGDERAGGLSDADALPRLTLQEELRIGSVTDPDEGFSRIGGVTVDEGGTVYVLEAQDNEIRVFDSAGSRLRTMGGAGEGPGEFRSPHRMGVIGDTLWVSDLLTRRITLFDRSGVLLGTLTPPPIQATDVPSGVLATLVPGELNADGSITTTFQLRFSIGQVASPAAVPDTFWLPTLRVDRSGAVLDTLLMLQFWTPGQPERITVGGRQLSVPRVPSSAPLVLEAAAGSYRVERLESETAVESAFTVTRLEGLADTLFRIELGYTPEPFPDEAVDSLIAPAVRTFVRGGGTDEDTASARTAATAALRGAVVLPAFQSPVSSGRVGNDTVLWLRREDAGGGTREWTLIDPRGRPIGSVDVPRSVTIHWSDGPVAWAAAQDDLGVPWLVRYRLASAP
jgi:hypothetical protein